MTRVFIQQPSNQPVTLPRLKCLATPTEVLPTRDEIDAIKRMTRLEMPPVSSPNSTAPKLTGGDHYRAEPHRQPPKHVEPRDEKGFIRRKRAQERPTGPRKESVPWPRWEPKTLRKMLELRKAGLNFRQIAEELMRKYGKPGDPPLSRSAVAGQFYRAKWPLRA